MTALLIIGLVVGLFWFIAAVLDWEDVIYWWDVEAVRAVFGDGAARLLSATAGLALIGVCAVALLS